MRSCIPIVLAAFIACRPHSEPIPDANAKPNASNAPQAPLSPAPTRLAPLSGVSWLEPLALPEGHVAYVTPPVGASEPRPLIVAVHGAGDRPEWACGGWRLAASDYAFVVCPRGLTMDAQRFAWDQPRTIAARVSEAIAAVRTRFGAYIADGPTLYVGFSQGATLADAALLDVADRFPYVALAEGGYNLMRDAKFLQQLRAHGTSRVLVVCGSPACFTSAEAARPAFTRAKLELSSAGDAKAGHNLNQRMQNALHEKWPAFVEGLPNWSGFPAYLAARR